MGVEENRIRGGRLSMKRAILISLAIAGGIRAVGERCRAGIAHGASRRRRSASNTIHVWLTSDGRSYVIDSIVPLEVGGEVCSNPAGNPNELVCSAPPIAGFEVNADGGDDRSRSSQGSDDPGHGARRDRPRHASIGGSGDDKLIGGPGPDRLIGGAGRRRPDRRPGQRRPDRRPRQRHAPDGAGLRLHPRRLGQEHRQ